MAHDVTLITGDGTGPELAEAARTCIDATGVKINWDVQEAGVDVMARTGTPLPDSVLESVRRTQVRPEGPDHHARRHRLSQHQRPPAAGAGPVRLHPALQAVPGRAELLQRAWRSTSSSSARTPKTSTPASSSKRGKPETGRADRVHQQALAPTSKIKTKADETGVSHQADQRVAAPSGSCAARSTTPASNKPQEGHGVHKANIMKYSDGL